MVRLLRGTKAVRFYEHISRFGDTKWDNARRLGALILMLVGVCHLTACGWRVVASTSGEVICDASSDFGGGQSVGAQYARALYYATVMILATT